MTAEALETDNLKKLIPKLTFKTQGMRSLLEHNLDIFLP